MKRRFVLFLLLLAVVHCGVFAQYTGANFYVSGLRAETRNHLVRLSWTDSKDALGPVYIFRSARPFAATIPPNIKPVAVPYGTGTFIDEIDGPQTIHYFIAASDVNGRRFDVFVPLANTVSVSPGAESGIEGSAEAELASAAQVLPVTTVLAARAEGERVIITHYPENANQEAAETSSAVLYRSNRPITQRQDLLNAAIVNSGIGSHFVDYPVSGFPWYYAVIYEDEITRGNIEIRPGNNATTSAVIIPGEAESAGVIRSTPLPFISAHYAAPSYGNHLWRIPERTPLSDQAQKALEDISGLQKSPLPERSPQIFSRDMEFPRAGEESALMQIVQDSFSRRDWETARIELINYISLPRSKEVEGRARFYLGQCWFFAGKYREALMEFLSVQSRYPDQAAGWIDASLAALVH